MDEQQIAGSNGIHEAGVDCLEATVHENLDAPPIPDGLDFRHAALVRAGDADVIGAIRRGLEKTRMLEHDVGQLPEKVVQQHDVARPCGNRWIDVLQPDHVLGAANGRAGTCSKPEPRQAPGLRSLQQVTRASVGR